MLFGQGARELEALIAGSSFDRPVALAETLDGAVSQALALSSDHTAQSLLLSPACASFDQYSNFEDRGDHFRRLIHAAQSEH